jgi:penicillin-binding protein 1A
VAALLEMLQEVVKSGTGTMARLPDRPVAGKTGTADEAKDIWFIGFTPDMVTAVWGGNDENKPIPGTYVTGGTVMAKIWKDYNLLYYEKHPTPPGTFIAPSGAGNALPATPSTPDTPHAGQNNPTLESDTTPAATTPQAPALPPPIIIQDDTQEPPPAPPLRHEQTNTPPPVAPDPMPQHSLRPPAPAPAAPLRPPLSAPVNTWGSNQ